MEDLTGRKFGKWQVIRYVGVEKKKYSVFECVCECGKVANVYGYRLKNGGSKSCGCSRKKTNQYDLSNDYGIGYFKDGDIFIFDKEDYNKIKDYRWSKSNGYVCHGAKLKIHRLIMNCPKEMVVDHINHNPLDNRKSNLRVCTQSQNMKNQKLRSTNVSGVTGVSTYNRNGKQIYRSRICVNGKNITIGYFENFEEAVKSRREAENKYFGEFSYI